MGRLIATRVPYGSWMPRSDHRLGPKQVQRMLTMRRRGALPDVVRAATGLHRRRQAEILSRPDYYDTDIDRIAIRRALAGDSSVLDAMTFFERQALHRRLLLLDSDELAVLEDMLGLVGMHEAINKANRRAINRASVAEDVAA